ncbi:type I restriction endonuclease [Campylobacter concisus]|uniref:type I restriction endonuclease n=1 Tax=Campylobacter concisus TaxID=199 RepID=UPI00122C60CD|nr:type I restriction endonuclease [Campylobacter concisus]
MDEVKAKIKEIAANIEKLGASITTEEATKNAFIMPFIRALGYDVFNPLEVMPEYTQDIGTKQGERIDYAIFQNNEPVLLVECKKIGAELNAKNESQLLRYFNVSRAKFAILTNGRDYKFYTDLKVEEKNIMDTTPFLSFDITKIKDTQVLELEKFHKKNFDLENIFNTANNLKYTNQLEKVVSAELENPSREFASYFFRKISDQVATEKRVEQIIPLLKAVFTGRINDMVRDRLTSALDKETKKEAEPLPPQEDENKIVTTQEELDAFYIIRAILAAVTNVENITYRDAQSYFAIFFNDNNRKPICRLYFTDNKKQIGIMDSEKNEARFQLDRIEDIYAYSEKLCDVAKFYATQN